MADRNTTNDWPVSGCSDDGDYDTDYRLKILLQIPMKIIKQSTISNGYPTEVDRGRS